MKPSVQSRSSSPADEMVTLDEAKAQLRVSHTDDDAYISALILAAREVAEDQTHRSFISQQWVALYEGWPCDGVFELPRPPLIEIDSITYRDVNDSEQTVDEEDYVVEVMANEVKLRQAAPRPSLSQDRSYPVTITFTAGYSEDATLVPSKAKQAVLMLIHHFYVNRVAVSDTPKVKVPMSVEYLLGSLKRRNM